MGRALERLELWITEASTSGSFLIPLLIYLNSFTSHQGELAYVLPFVLFYAFNKTGGFILEGFGTPSNAYKLSLLGLWIAIAGCIVSMLGFLDIVVLDFGASLTGLGTAIFSPMYSTLKGACRTGNHWQFGRVEVSGGIIALPIVAGVTLSQGRIQEVTYLGYAVMLLVAVLAVRGIASLYGKRTEAMFSPRQLRWRKFVPAILFFAAILLVRLFKQTASAFDILCVVAVVIAISLVTAIWNRRYIESGSSLHRMFFSGAMVYAILFDVVVYVVCEEYIKLIIVSEIFLLGCLVTTAFGAKIAKRLEGRDVPNIALVCLMLSNIPFLFDLTNPAGIFLIAFFSTFGLMAVGMEAKPNTSIPKAAASLHSQNTSDVGSILGQTVLFAAIAVVSFVAFSDVSEMMAAYAFQIPKEHLDAEFHIVQIACSVVIWVLGVLFLIRARDRRDAKTCP